MPREVKWWTRIRMLRLRMHLTQEQAAREVNKATTTWNKWEQGKQLPSAANRTLIADLLGVTVDTIWPLNQKIRRKRMV